MHRHSTWSTTMALSHSTDMIQCVVTYSPLQMDAKHFGSSLRLTHWRSLLTSWGVALSTSHSNIAKTCKNYQKIMNQYYITGIGHSGIERCKNIVCLISPAEMGLHQQSDWSGSGPRQERPWALNVLSQRSNQDQATSNGETWCSSQLYRAGVCWKNSGGNVSIQFVWT